MKRLNHKFFDIIDACSKVHTPYSLEFFKELKTAHPFIFDESCSIEAASQSTNYKMLDKDNYISEKENRTKVRDVQEDLNKIVEEFSLPFKNSLYILTNVPTFIAEDNLFVIKVQGYLIIEKTPETFTIFVIAEVRKVETDFFKPMFYKWELNLKNIEEPEETLLLIRLTKMISVKRIGIEHNGFTNIKNKKTSSGFTVIKYDNLYHIADLIQYHYTKSIIGDEKIDFSFIGWRRGHWRAFYLKDNNGDTIKDFKGWNTVDYEKTGKDRQGNYIIPGYTWVIEHIVGNPQLAEIKTRIVRNKK